MKIALSKASGSSSSQNYHNWFKKADDTVEIVDLISYSPEEAVELLRDCAGLVLTGGNDVDPANYDQPEKTPLCGEFDTHRDALELAVAKAAVEMRMPVLGICRGLQMLNVAFGGTLIADIPSQTVTDIEHRQVERRDSLHPVSIEGGSVLKRITKTLDGEINSAHHQAIERIAPVFTAVATAPDGIIEAIEWGDATLGGKPFLLAVQWHPERMSYDSPFSLPIAEHFLFECSAYYNLFQRSLASS